MVDDHSVNRLLATKLLEQLGFEVDVAEDGEQAVRAVQSLKNSPFDVIFMDIQMPVMNGWQVTHHIREWETSSARTRVPIIALSAHASAADREHALSSGMDGYLSKPLTPEALQAGMTAEGAAEHAKALEQAAKTANAAAAKQAFDHLSETARDTFNVVKNW